MNEVWFRTRMRAFPRPVVVLDVSAAAAPLWPVLLSTVEGLGEVLPEPARPDVAFLGSARRVPFAEFLRDADALHAANAGRGRVISPLLESFRAEWPARVVILGTRPIVDLADWKHTPRVGRLMVVRTDPTVSAANGACAEADLTDVEAVARLVHRPITGVRVSVSGGLPAAWDNPAFRFDAGRLAADTIRDVTAGFLCAADTPVPSAEVAYADGTADRIGVEPVDPPAELPWRPLTSPELTMLDAWRGGRVAHCSRCGAGHAVGELVCRDGGWMLPSLATVPPGGFVRLRVKMFQASFQPTRGPVLRTADEAAVVRTQSGPPVVWRFDPTRGAWAPTDEPWGAFERLGDDEFALAVPAEGGTP